MVDRRTEVRDLPEGDEDSAFNLLIIQDNTLKFLTGGRVRHVPAGGTEEQVLSVQGGAPEWIDLVLDTTTQDSAISALNDALTALTNRLTVNEGNSAANATALETLQETSQDTRTRLVSAESSVRDLEGLEPSVNTNTQQAASNANRVSALEARVSALESGSDTPVPDAVEHTVRYGVSATTTPQLAGTLSSTLETHSTSAAQQLLTWPAVGANQYLVLIIPSTLSLQRILNDGARDDLRFWTEVENYLTAGQTLYYLQADKDITTTSNFTIEVIAT